MLLLKCPKCGNSMKYSSTDGILYKKRKACVYCGHSFKVSSHITSSSSKNLPNSKP